MQFDPTISGDIVVFTELRGGSQNVVYVNLTTGEYVWVSEPGASQRLADIDGHRIVYTDYTSGAQIMVHDINTGETRPAVEENGIKERPRINGDHVVYEYRSGTWFIRLTDLSTNETIQLNDGSYQDVRPTVHEGLVAFERREGTRYIMLHDLETGDQWAAAPQVGDRQERPHMDGDLLVFDAIPPSENHRDLFLHNLSTGDTLRLDLPGDQRRGRISGGFVSFVDPRENDLDIGLWHVPTCNLHTIPDNSDDADFLNDIDGNRVVFTSNRGGSFDIWLYEFVPLPVLHLVGQGDPSLCPMIDDRFKEV